MKCQIPQISWHGRDPVLSVDFQLVEGEIRRLATGGTDSHVIIWYVTICPKNTISLECACDLSRHNKSVNVVRFSPNGELLASGDDEGGILLWKLRETNQPKSIDTESDSYKEEWVPVRLLRGHLDDICDLSWSPGSDHIISGSIDNCVLVWDIQKGLNFRVANDAKGFVQGVTWDPLNQSFASISSDRVLRIYSSSTRKIMHRVHRAPWSTPSNTVEKGLNKPKKLFHDDTLQSFSRRLTFTPDGSLLLVPSGIKEKDEKICHTTYAFSRLEYRSPLFHLPSGQKYTVAVRCCPKLFKLREVKNLKHPTPLMKLPYRMLFAVATQDSIFLYDTQQLMPFAYVSDIHYTHLTDLSWSSDGRLLIASSTDGYCSFVIFSEGELGDEYVPEMKEPVTASEDKLCSAENTVVFKPSEETPKSPPTADKENISVCPTQEVAVAEPVKKPKTSKPGNNPPSVKTPSTKKSSADIMSFFTPPSKKLKPNNESDVEFPEEKPAKSDVPVSVEQPKEQVSSSMMGKVEGDASGNLTNKDLKPESSGTKPQGDIPSDVMEDDSIQFIECIDEKETPTGSSQSKSSNQEKPIEAVAPPSSQSKDSSQEKPVETAASPVAAGSKSVVAKPKRRIQFVTISEKVSAKPVTDNN